MKLYIEYEGRIEEVQAAEGASVLDVLQEHAYPVRATCGGVGKCRRCQVLIRDDTGARYALACMEKAADGMMVAVESQAAMAVVDDAETAGMAQFPLDEGATGFGMAVDIGTTTLAAHLHDLSTGKRVATVSRANPQIAFGADVISRISASVDGKLLPMAALIEDALIEMRTELCSAAGISVEDVCRVTIAGNTVMQHIAAGLPPDTIGVNPFTPVSLFGSVEHRLGRSGVAKEGSSELGTCYFTPCVAGYVGGDITAGMLVRHLDDGSTRLFLDLGTNGEMALSHKGRIVCCATAAGPVFEGANIRFGMPAGPGSIRKVEKTGEGEIGIEVIGDCEPLGICGTGLIDAIALLVDEGVIDETGYLLDDEEAPTCWRHLIGEEDGETVFYLTQDRKIYLTQPDVRNVQLAKAAVCAGVYTLMDHFGITEEQIESLEIAGGFGRFLDMKAAARVGLYPAQLQDRASSVGNTSAEGASALLVSAVARDRAARIARECDYLELSTSAKFNGFYIEMMEF
ncbi:MAG: DUF4445 domain-containing protein [Eggerthellaceae bacterium]|nr:DUF4445 domain-containing protein [Eggerthellaceae bacterium]